MSEIQMRGADDFLRLSKALKRAGKTELRKELNKGLKEGVKPMLPLAAQVLAEAMPPGKDDAKTENLPERGAKVHQAVIVKTGRNPGVTIGIRYAKRGLGLGASNARLANRTGNVRHPVYGRREGKGSWASTPVPRALGWFDHTHGQNYPLVLPALDRALQTVADRVVEEAKRG